MAKTAEPEDDEIVIERPHLGRVHTVRRQVGAFFADGFFKGASRLGRSLPMAAPGAHNVELIRDVPYQETGQTDHLLDVYRPLGATTKLPVVLYLHGGGFRTLSKETHWLFGLIFARRGYVLFNINYRTSPNTYPAAIQDACEAYAWVVENAASYGGDATRLVLAGESAGANLATGLAITACYERPEPWARRVFETERTPSAVMAACGILQVSNPERYRRIAKVNRFSCDRIAEVTDAYLHSARVKAVGGLDLADPLVVFERQDKPARQLPPFFIPCGTWDPLIHDSQRLEQALVAMGARCEARYYKRELHAFHALLASPGAFRCWKDTFEFLRRHA